MVEQVTTYITANWVAAIALGFLVCYAAMFGYDNLYKQIMETVQKIRELLAGITKDAE